MKSWDKILVTAICLLIPLLGTGQGKITRHKNTSNNKAKVHSNRTSDKRLISEAELYFQNGEYENSWLKLMEVTELKSDTVYLMLLGDIGYIYKPNYSGGGRWCYEKAARLGSKQAEVKSHSFFRDNALCSYYSTMSNPGDSLNKLGFETEYNDMNTRINYFERAVEFGSTSAMVNLGRIYEQGQNGNFDFEKAAQLYLQAYTINKYSEAADHLAWLYSMGLGVPVDYKKSFELYRNLDYDRRNKVNLAICYDYGVGIEPDKYVAFMKYADVLCSTTEQEEWLIYAANRYIDLSNDFSLNQNELSGNIGNLYYNLYVCFRRKLNSDSLTSSEKKNYNSIAEHYLEAAISEGVTEVSAMNNIGNILQDRKRYNEAFEWYEKASNSNDPYAFFNLGECYENGIGVNRNLTKAKEWYLKAKEAGNRGAKHALERLAKKGVK